MPRSDRLVEMIRILRDGRLHRAEDMAERLGVSARTVYRDMDRLIASGVPIEGRRGLGYRATAAVTLPPLNLTMTELEALHLGLAAVTRAEDAELRAAALSLSGRIDAVLPEDRDRAGGWSFATPPLGDAVTGFRHMGSLRAAIRARQKLQVTMRDAPVTQVLRPLRLDYWGRVWTLTGWNETTRDFAELRVDRIAALKVLPQLFVDEPGRMLADLEAARGARA
ncbi:HTH domain-containing protein [Limimaricola variabilis]|uniref:helix-turn-helix transcriptional regulator n=1 Tax=Limimaricola variabilis TaxID=1492771 RepID=UPI002AC90F60|nr:HTH domain-containing protein [Limimaricola variabilis]WPY95715.1 HTH domain-containing protein [Limimaricola variabilis]